MLIIDAHEDIAWNMLTFGRDYTRPVAETRAREAGTAIVGQAGEAMLGWPEWLTGEVGIVFATLYASPAGSDCCVPPSRHTYRTAQEAHDICQAQLQLYRALVTTHPDKVYLITTQAELAAGVEQWRQAPAERRVGLVLLMEGADAIREPAEVADWYAAGVRIVGPAWGRTRYAGGTGAPGPLTEAGRELLRHMAGLGMILDLSHLTEAGVDEALAGYPGPIIASHSNAQALLPHNSPERHLTDAAVRRLAEREGVIGVMLFNEFLQDGVKLGDPRQLVALDTVATHLDHYCQLVGHSRHLGLGSDFDGGFGRADVPPGLESIADLGRIGELLEQRGYTKADIEGIMGGNWLRLLHRTLPD